MSTSDGSYRIAEVAQRTGFSAATLRYYEDVGLLPPAGRTASGYRVYDDRSIDRLTFIARAKQLGCSLEEIAELVEAWDTDRCGPVKHRLRSLVADKVTDTQVRIGHLVSFAADLQATLAALADLPLDGPCDASCGCTTAPTANASVAVPLIAEAEARMAAPAIACTLGADDIRGRIAEWQAVLSHAAGRSAIDGGVRVAFGADPPLAEIARLVDAEHDCCRFFSFAITIDGRGVGLEVRAPDGADELVASVFGSAA